MRCVCVCDVGRDLPSHTLYYYYYYYYYYY